MGFDWVYIDLDDQGTADPQKKKVCISYFEKYLPEWMNMTVLRLISPDEANSRTTSAIGLVSCKLMLKAFGTEFEALGVTSAENLTKIVHETLWKTDCDDLRASFRALPAVCFFAEGLSY